ncbi:MAG: DUF2026 family protein [Betaproteobacteria bacterium]
MSIALPLPLQEFALIARTIHSVLAPEKADHTKACLHYGITGALILDYHYGIKARPIVGAAIYCIGVSDKPDVLAFMVPGAPTVASTAEHFHCWLETEDWLLDFTAPYFPETIEAMGLQRACPRRAFQKRVTEQASSVENIRSPGDCLHVPNAELTKDLLLRFANVRAQSDLVQIAVDWFRRPPEVMQSNLTLANAKGSKHAVPLLGLKLSESW